MKIPKNINSDDFIKFIKHSSFYKLVVLFVLCFVLLKNFTSNNKHESVDSEKFIPVVTKIYKIDYKPVLTVSGFVKAVDSCYFSVPFKANVKKIHVRQGLKVKKNDLIITLESREVEEQIVAAKSSYEHKLAEFKAAEKLTKKHFYSDNSLLAAKAALDKAKYDLEKAQYEFENLTIKAPEDGYVEECLIGIGDNVSMHEKLIKFVYEGAPLIRAYVSESSIAKIKHGMKAKVHVEGKTFNAIVCGIANSANIQTKNFFVELKLEKDNVFFNVGRTVYVDLFLDSKKGFWINSSALTFNDNDEIGIKILNPDDSVGFEKIEFYSIYKDGCYIESDKDFLNLISYGGEFLKVGQPLKKIHYQKTETL